MAVYKDFIMTNQGIDLFAELLQGSGELEFRFLAAGSGTYADGENSVEYIRGMGGLKEERQRVSFMSVKKAGEGTVNLKADLSNQGLSEGYLMTEVGIYAGIAGVEESVLYCVATTENPDYMPDFSAGRMYNVVFRTLVSIGDAEEVTVKYTPDSYVSKEEFQEELAKKVDIEDRKGLSSNDYTDQDKEAVSGLGGLKFGQDEDGSWGYTAPGTTEVVPFGKGGNVEDDGRFERIVIGFNSSTTFEGGTVFATFPRDFVYKYGQVFVEIVYTLYSRYGSIANYSTGMVMVTRTKDEFKVPLDGILLQPGSRSFFQRIATIKNTAPHTEISAGDEIVISKCSSLNFIDNTFKDGTEGDIYIVPHYCFLYVKNKTIQNGVEIQ